ncbi:unnamed protein product, partial [marine sediment metagenome]
MELVLELNKNVSINVEESNNLKEIKNVLDELLYVPDIRLKPRIISELIKYLKTKFLDENYKIMVFIAYHNSEIYGFVISQIHPTYTSYGRKCGTFGWL